MPERRNDRLISRRSLLKSLGVAAGASFAGSLRLSGSAAACIASTPSKRLGIVQDRRAPYRDDFINGIRLGWEGIAIAAIHSPNSVAEMRRAVSDLLDDPAIDDVVVRMNPAHSHWVLPSSTHPGYRRLVLADMGERVVVAPPAGLRRVSLGYSAASVALGEWTVEQFGGRVLLISSLEEAGFAAISGYRHGVTAGHGEIVETMVVDHPIGIDPRLVARRASDHVPDAIALFTQPDRAAEILRNLRDVGMGAIPVVASPFTVGEREIDPVFYGVYTLCGWSPSSVPGSPLAAVVGSFRELSGRVPGTSALLGYAVSRHIREIDLPIPVQVGTVVPDRSMAFIKPLTEELGQRRLPPASNGWCVPYGSIGAEGMLAYNNSYHTEVRTHG